MIYNPSNWYWSVGGDTAQLYSSAAGTFVAADNQDYATWTAAGGVASYIADVSTLRGILAAQYPAGWPKDAAQTALDEADTTMLRVAEAVALGANSWTNADVVAWVNYRRDLRAVVRGTSTTLPAKPAYPAGT